MTYITNPYAFGASAGTPHRYWRINVSAADGGANIAILELHMRESVHGPNVATIAANVSASSNLLFHDPGDAFSSNWDEDTGAGVSSWASSTGANEWLRYDFGAGNQKAIVAVDIWARPDTAFSTQSPKDFTIEYSDNGSSWTVAWTVTGSTGWRSREHRKFVKTGHTDSSTMGSHTYWRIMVTESHGAASNTGIGEIEFRSVAGVSQSSTGGTPLASSELSSTYSAAKAFAGDGGTTHWTSAQGANSFNAQEIQYQHTSARTVAQLMLQARNDAFRNEHPKYFQLLWSDNGTNWTHGADCSTLSAWGLNEIRTFNVP